MPLLLALHTIKPSSSENGGIFSEFVANTIILHTEYIIFIGDAIDVFCLPGLVYA